MSHFNDNYVKLVSESTFDKNSCIPIQITTTKIVINVGEKPLLKNL